MPLICCTKFVYIYWMLISVEIQPVLPSFCSTQQIIVFKPVSGSDNHFNICLISTEQKYTSSKKYTTNIYTCIVATGSMYYHHYTYTVIQYSPEELVFKKKCSNINYITGFRYWTSLKFSRHFL